MGSAFAAENLTEETYGPIDETDDLIGLVYAKTEESRNITPTTNTCATPELRIPAFPNFDMALFHSSTISPTKSYDHDFSGQLLDIDVGYGSVSALQDAVFGQDLREDAAGECEGLTHEHASPGAPSERLDPTYPSTPDCRGLFTADRTANGACSPPLVILSLPDAALTLCRIAMGSYSSQIVPAATQDTYNTATTPPSVARRFPWYRE